jgi:hypothetical protein
MMGKRRSGPPESPTRSSRRPVAGTSPARVSAMLHPADHAVTRPLAVRDGQGAPVTCATCGCRLTQSGEAWFHFNPIAGRDARGCRIACADAAHDLTGRPVSVAV